MHEIRNSTHEDDGIEKPINGDEYRYWNDVDNILQIKTTIIGDTVVHETPALVDDTIIIIL